VHRNAPARYNARPVPASTYAPPPPPTMRAGALPAWSTADLPAPPPFTPRNAGKVIGPGAILLATAIGGGEWLVGPAVGVKYGVAVMGVATLAIALQLVFNLEAIRYTLYTGEPIFSGFMRTKPGPAFWGWLYSILGFIQLGWPGWAASAATAIVAALIAAVPGPQHQTQVLIWGYIRRVFPKHLAAWRPWPAACCGT
jgi:hypothetical protein